MWRNSKDLLLVIGVAIGAALLTLLPATHSLVRALFAVPLVLFLPGYALAEALFRSDTLASLDRIVLSLGLSLIVTILGALALNTTTRGLTTASWAFLLSATTIVAGTAALVRRRLHRSERGTHWRLTLDVSQIVMIGVAALLAGGSIAIARSGALHQPSPGFTQLWAAPAGNAGGPGSSQQSAARARVIHLGVGNYEASSVQYRLQVTAAGKVVREWTPIKLEAGGVWETVSPLPMPQHFEDAAVEVLLYRLDTPQVVYRRVQLQARLAGSK